MKESMGNDAGGGNPDSGAAVKFKTDAVLTQVSSHHTDHF